ncbi:MAG: hypothetical protein PSV18_14265 [Methylobacter sp.]|nr:hypothetical protein [Candidatus Methylobacter titanis]
MTIPECEHCKRRQAAGRRGGSNLATGHLTCQIVAHRAHATRGNGSKRNSYEISQRPHHEMPFTTLSIALAMYLTVQGAGKQPRLDIRSFPVRGFYQKSAKLLMLLFLSKLNAKLIIQGSVKRND